MLSEKNGQVNMYGETFLQQFKDIWVYLYRKYFMNVYLHISEK